MKNLCFSPLFPSSFCFAWKAFWLMGIFGHVLYLRTSSSIVRAAFVLCVYNLISVVARYDSLCVRIHFAVKKTASGHGIRESCSMFVSEALRWRMAMWSCYMHHLLGFEYEQLKASWLRQCFFISSIKHTCFKDLNFNKRCLFFQTDPWNRNFCSSECFLANCALTVLALL